MQESGLVKFEEKTVLTAFTDNDGLDAIITQAKDLVGDFDHDLSTAAGRARTASLANKVAKLKTKLDGMGKDLVSEWKTKAKAVDGNRKSMRDALDELKVEARKPLTQWEEEQAKIEADKKAAAEAEKLLAEKENDHELALLLDEKFDAEMAKVARIVAAEQAEKERLEFERQEQEKQRAAEAARLEAEEKAKAEIDKAEQEKQKAIEATKAAERAKIAAEERAKLEAEQAETRRIEAEKNAKLQAEQAAEAAKQKQIAEQQAKEKAEADALAKREANKKHIGAIRKAAKESIMAVGIDEDKAKELVMAIHAGLIANVTINY